jgi:hypothetical protein
LDNILPIIPDAFSEVLRVSKNAIALPDKKREQGAQSILGTLNLTYQAIENVISTKQVTFRDTLVEAFAELQKNTDDYLNSLLDLQSFAFLQVLLEAIDKRLADFEASFRTYMDSFPSAQHDHSADLIAAIEARAGHLIPPICVKRARANLHGPILTTLSGEIQGFRREIAKRIEWCRAAND